MARQRRGEVRFRQVAAARRGVLSWHVLNASCRRGRQRIRSWYCSKDTPARSLAGRIAGMPVRQEAPRARLRIGSFRTANQNVRIARRSWLHRMVAQGLSGLPSRGANDTVRRMPPAVRRHAVQRRLPSGPLLPGRRTGAAGRRPGHLAHGAPAQRPVPVPGAVPFPAGRQHAAGRADRRRTIACPAEHARGHRDGRAARVVEPKSEAV